MARHPLWGNIAIDVGPRWLGSGIFQMGTCGLAALSWASTSTVRGRRLPTGCGWRVKPCSSAPALPLSTPAPSVTIIALGLQYAGLRLHLEQGDVRNSWAPRRHLQAEEQTRGPGQRTSRVLCRPVSQSTGPCARQSCQVGEGGRAAERQWDWEGLSPSSPSRPGSLQDCQAASGAFGPVRPQPSVPSLM